MFCSFNFISSLISKFILSATLSTKSTKSIVTLLFFNKAYTSFFISCDELFSNTLNTYNGLFESEEELYRIVFGNYMEESSYGKRPLSKLTKDILSKLLIEIYGFNVQ